MLSAHLVENLYRHYTSSTSEVLRRKLKRVRGSSAKVVCLLQCNVLPTNYAVPAKQIKKQYQMAVVKNAWHVVGRAREFCGKQTA
jgi:hypothetical protein